MKKLEEAKNEFLFEAEYAKRGEKLNSGAYTQLSDEDKKGYTACQSTDGLVITKRRKTFPIIQMQILTICGSLKCTAR